MSFIFNLHKSLASNDKGTQWLFERVGLHTIL